MTVTRRLQRFLRASMLALLVLGLIAKPMMLFVCEVNSYEHARIAAMDPHGIHFQGDRDDPGDHGESGVKHTHGADGFWHQLGPAFAPVVPSVTLALIQLPHVAVPPLTVPDIDTRAPSTPFRPPIA